MKGKIQPKKAKGITLIALVITIIVLLILAGVTIATLTGDNGILTQAGKAKEQTKEKDALEKIKLQVLSSYRENGEIDLEELNYNLENNIPELIYNGNKLSKDNEIKKLPVMLILDTSRIVIEGNGNVTKVDYTELEYIESTGTQYIDTGLKPTVNTKCEFGVMTTSSTGALIGYVRGNDDNDYRLFIYGNRLYFDFKNFRNSIYNPLEANNYKKIEIGNYYVKVNDKQVIDDKYVSNFIADYDIYIFKNSPKDTIASLYKLYYLKIYEGNELVRDFIPVLDNKKVVCLYDKVENRFYYNQGTGEFLGKER